MILAVSAAVLLLLYVRRRLERRWNRTQPVFTLHDLRRLRDEGHLSPEEYETLKERVLSESRADFGQG